MLLAPSAIWREKSIDVIPSTYHVRLEDYNLLIQFRAEAGFVDVGAFIRERLLRLEHRLAKIMNAACALLRGAWKYHRVLYLWSFKGTAASMSRLPGGIFAKSSKDFRGSVLRIARSHTVFLTPTSLFRVMHEP